MAVVLKLALPLDAKAEPRFPAGAIDGRNRGAMQTTYLQATRMIFEDHAGADGYGRLRGWRKRRPFVHLATGLSGVTTILDVTVTRHYAFRSPLRRAAAPGDVGWCGSKNCGR